MANDGGKEHTEREGERKGEEKYTLEVEEVPQSLTAAVSH